jgi:hypothetical protein
MVLTESCILGRWHCTRVASCMIQYVKFEALRLLYFELLATCRGRRIYRYIRVKVIVNLYGESQKRYFDASTPRTFRRSGSKEQEATSQQEAEGIESFFPPLSFRKSHAADRPIIYKVQSDLSTLKLVCQCVITTIAFSHHHPHNNNTVISSIAFPPLGVI